MITVYGASDDMIEVEGDIREEWDYFGEDPDWAGDIVAFSDGTVLRVQFTDEGFWRITPHLKGSAFLRIDQATDEDEDYSDKARLEGDDVRWVVHGRHYAKR
jgi:hypothetical protein